MRWPVGLGVLSVGGVVFMIGMAQNFGYTGTTPLRPMSVKEWNDFSSKVVAPSSADAKKGKPYYFVDKTPEIKGEVVQFDSRLTKIFNYLAKADKKQTCGTTKQHESLGISTEAPEISDLSYPSTNARSASTLFRGVGVRVSSADKMKCTKRCTDPATGIVTYLPFAKFDIPLDGKPVTRTEPVPPNCVVYCAVDYYPDGHLFPPGMADIDEIAQPQVASIIAKLDPSRTSFIFYNYPTADNFDDSMNQAGIYKTAQLAYEIMHTDDAGCDAKEKNTGNMKIIPYTVIFPEWVWSSSSFADNNMTDFFKKLAEDVFPFYLQDESPAAGITHDPLLVIGLHLNY